MSPPSMDGRFDAVTRRAAFLATVASVALAQPALGQEMRGTVALPDSSGVAGVLVELHRVTAESGELVDSARTDQSGGFTFDLASDAEPGTLFVAGARYHGVLYWGPPVHESARDVPTDYSVVVYDTAVVSAPVRTLRTTIRHIVITPAPGALQVEEILDVQGLPDRTLVGASDSGAVWSVALAEGAHGVVPAQGGAEPEHIAVENDGTVSFRGALPPSGVRLALRYVVPSSDYTLRIGSPTSRLEMLVMPEPGLELLIEGLEEAPTGSEMRIPVRRFTGTDLDTGSTVTVRTVIEQPGRKTAWVWLILSIALGAAALLSARYAARFR